MNIESQYLISNYLLGTQLLKKTDGQLSIHGISFTEFMILNQLDSTSQKTMRRVDLADAIGITASGVTRLLSPMEKIGLLQKQQNPRDARVSLVKLTSAGQKLYSEALTSFEQFAESKLAVLNKKQLEKITELTQKLI